MSRLARLAIRHPRPLLGFWLVAFVVSFAIGRSSDDSLHTADLQIERHAGQRGDQALEPRVRRHDRDGRAAARHERQHRARSTGEGPRIVRRARADPRRARAQPVGRRRHAHAARAARPGAAGAAGTEAVRADLERDHARRCAGRSTATCSRRCGPTSSATRRPRARSTTRSSTRCASGELLALLILIPLLLLVFRGVVAAIVPGISGVLDDRDRRGVDGAAQPRDPDRRDRAQHPDDAGAGARRRLLAADRVALPRGAGGRQGRSSEAVETATVKAGRTVLFAGLTLAAGMLVALLILPGGVLVSGTLGRAGRDGDGDVDRDAGDAGRAGPARPQHQPAADRRPSRAAAASPRFATRALRKPGIAAALVALPLVLLCAPAIALDSRPAELRPAPGGQPAARRRRGLRAQPAGWLDRAVRGHLPHARAGHLAAAAASARPLPGRADPHPGRRRGARPVGAAALQPPAATADATSSRPGTSSRRELERSRCVGSCGDRAAAQRARRPAREGSDQLVNGLEQAKSGTATLNQSVQEAAPGTQQLANGVEQTGQRRRTSAAEGADELKRPCQRAAERRRRRADAPLNPVPGRGRRRRSPAGQRAASAQQRARPPRRPTPRCSRRSGPAGAGYEPAGDRGRPVDRHRGRRRQQRPRAGARRSPRKVANGSAELASGSRQLDHGIAQDRHRAPTRSPTASAQLAGGTSALDNGIGLLLNGPSGDDGARALSQRPQPGRRRHRPARSRCSATARRRRRGARRTSSRQQDSLKRNGTEPRAHGSSPAT